MNVPSSRHFEFSCPSCLRPIKASLKAAGQTLPCPGCGKEITIPTPAESLWEAADESVSGDEYGLAEPGEHTRYKPTVLPDIAEQSYQKALEDEDDHPSPPPSPSSPGNDAKTKTGGSALSSDDEELLIVERPKLPPHPMTTGIFSIFADPSAITWFIVLTFGVGMTVGILTVPMLIFSGLVQLMSLGDAGVFIIGAVNTGGGTLVGLCVLFFSSNCLLCILQDSAAGNRTIESWPDKAGGGFSLEGILFISVTLFYSIGIGLLFSWLLCGQVHCFPVQLGIGILTFPFFLVSALEIGSPAVPISIDILRSLFARFSTWVTFYIESIVLCLIGLGATLLVMGMVGPKPMMLSVTFALILGPLFTFLLFIYFRLLGRLIWVCDEWFRSLEPEEEEDEEADDDEGPC